MDISVMIGRVLHHAIALTLLACGALGHAHGQEGDDLSVFRKQVTELQSQGKNDEALQSAERYLAIVKERRGEEHAEFAAALAFLANVQSAQRRYQDAKQSFERALAIRERVLGTEHRLVVNDLNSLAIAHRRLGQHKEAEPLYLRALAITEASLGREHVDVANLLVGLGFTREALNRLEEAEQLFHRAMGIAEKAFGANETKLIPFLTALGQVTAKQKRHAEAANIYLRILEIQTVKLQPELEVSGTLTTLANIYWRQGRVADAEPLYARALTIIESVRGPDHVEVATALRNLADLLNHKQRYKEADALYRRALQIREAVMGQDHREVGFDAYRLAAVSKRLNNDAEAEIFLRRALQIAEKQPQPDSVSIGRLANELGVLLYIQKRYPEAELLYVRALSILETAQGADHNDVTTTQKNLAQVYFFQSRLSEAEMLYLRAIAIQRHALGEEHDSVGATLRSMGIFYQAQGKMAEAESFFNQALSILTKHRNADDPELLEISNSISMLGRIADVNKLGGEIATLAEERRFVEGEARARQAVLIAESLPGTVALPIALGLLASLHELQSRYSDAVPLRERSIALWEGLASARLADRTNAQFKLGRTLSKLGRLEEAKSLFKRTLHLHEASGSNANQHIASILIELSSIAKLQNDTEGETYLARAISILEKALGENDADVIALESLADAHAVWERYDQAALYYEKLLETLPQTGGSASKYDDLASIYEKLGRETDAVRAEEKAFSIRVTAMAENHRDVVHAMYELANKYYQRRRYRDAEKLFSRIVTMFENKSGLDSLDTAEALIRSAGVYQAQGRYSDAERLLTRVLTIKQKHFGLHHPQFANALLDLAANLESTGKLTPAIALQRQALAILEGLGGKGHLDTLPAMEQLATNLWMQGLHEQAEPLLLGALAIYEQNKQRESLATFLVRVAEFYTNFSKTTLANQFIEKASRIAKEVDSIAALTALSRLYVGRKQYAEAESIRKRIVSLEEQQLPVRKLSLSRAYRRLGDIYFDTERYGEAGRAYQEALDLAVVVLPDDDSELASILGGLSSVSWSLNKYGDAYSYIHRASQIFLKRQADGTAKASKDADFEISEKTRYFRGAAWLGFVADPHDVGVRSDTFKIAQWAERTEAAAAFGKLAARYAERQEGLSELTRTHQDLGFQIETARNNLRVAIANGDSLVAQNVRLHVANLEERLSALDKEILDRFPKYAALSNPRPVSIPEAQALLAQNEALYFTLEMPAIAGGPATLAWVITKTEARWARLTFDPLRLANSVKLLRCGLDHSAWHDDGLGIHSSAGGGKGLFEFSKHSCSNLGLPKPRMERIKKSEVVEMLPFDVLRAHELYKALFGPFEDLIEGKHIHIVPSGTLANLPFHVLVTQRPSEFSSAHDQSNAWLGVLINDVTEEIAHYHGLSEPKGVAVVGTVLDSPAAAAGIVTGDIVLALDGNEVSTTAGLAAAVRAKPPGSALEVLLWRKGENIKVTVAGLRMREVGIPRTSSDYRKVAWLGVHNPITVLPSLSALKSLRQDVKSGMKARSAYLGVGNPLLDGEPNARPWEADWAGQSRAKQTCPNGRYVHLKRPLEGRRASRVATQGGRADADHLRLQTPLHDTADELCAVAMELKVAPNDIILGSRATESTIKKMSDDGTLAKYRVLHFATHGVLAGEIDGTTEPGLILTPPKVQTDTDDGYLSASEVAALKLDADWVILSACNTAGGNAKGAETLSGLARAFIYAGARALLVSHWAVDSPATVQLVSSAIHSIARDPKIGRAEALRRAMSTLVQKGKSHEAHPAYWAPFVVVGEGTARQ